MQYVIRKKGDGMMISYKKLWKLLIDKELNKKTNYIKSSEKQNQNSECFEMRDNNCNK